MTIDPIALWVIPVADVGGVGRHVLDVARVGIPGWRLVVLCPPGPVADALEAMGRPVLKGPVDPASGIRAGVAEVRHTVKTLRPVVVHSHLSYADLLVAVGGAGARRLSTEHGIADDDLVYHGTMWRSRVAALGHTARIRRFHGLIAVSEATRRAMARKWHVTRPVTVIPNGVDRAGHASGGPGWRFLSLARLAPEKRLPDLVAAFALVHGEHPEARLTIAGDGPAAGAVRSAVAAHDLAAAVTMPGFVDAAAALRRHDVVVQLSVFENCSYTLLDAMEHGLGVVASPAGGNVEMLPATALVDPSDPAAVARAMVRQATDPAARPALPSSWPTVTDMTARIAHVYAETVA